MADLKPEGILQLNGTRWRINVGPLPVVIRHQATADEEWAWRVSNRDHITVVIVRVAPALMSKRNLPPRLQEVIRSKGMSAIKNVLHWTRPPREIRFAEVSDIPVYWGGEE